ncbi:MAG TPA: class I SAM-dependent methyltransferase [Bdellovibrio sp.]|uniref:class I SAM-dependent methyltransferase n=1 Tax=Bdellovibrio sp. TaxID=28201 RepID=UPI002F21132C
MNTKNTIPDHTAVRVALWRAMHAQLDAKPSVLEDEVGLKLVAPDENWKQRPDMHPQGTRGYRGAIIARARFIEDLVIEQSQHGVNQYVILGAGLDSFAQRRPTMASNVQVFEIDKAETQSWKRQRLQETGFGIPNYLHFVPVDFEAGESWIQKLKANGFDAKKPAVISSTGVAMYLTREANLASLREIATLAPGSTLALSFLLPLDLIDPAERPGHEMVYEKAKAAGTPIISFFRPEEIVALAKEAGFKDAKYISREDLIKKYFAGRSDGLVPGSGEEILVAST